MTRIIYQDLTPHEFGFFCIIGGMKPFDPQPITIHPVSVDDRFIILTKNRVDHDLANAVTLQPGLLGSSPKVLYQVHHHAPGVFGYTEEKEKKH